MPNYCAPPDSPLGSDPVAADGKFYHVKTNVNYNYYCYAIFDHQPTSPNGACKEAGDDHDTGLNIKR